jgi:flagellar hook-length control protein FliK
MKGLSVMTIAPFSVLGNTQGATAQTGGGVLGSGGLAGFFAALLGGQNIESLEGLGLQTPSEGSDEAVDLFSLFKDIDFEGTGGLGETLKLFLPPNLEDSIQQGQSAENLLASLFPENSEVAGEPLSQLLSTSESQVNVFYEKIVVEIQKVAVSLHVSGVDLSGVDSLDALAKAFEKFGMSTTEAMEKAERVDEAIKLMQRRLGIETADSDGENSLVSAIYELMTGQDLPNAEMHAAHTHIQISRTTIAFESSSSLVSADIGMKVMKGEPLHPSLQGHIGETVKTAETLASSSSDKATVLNASAGIQGKTSDFELLTADDLPKQSAFNKPAEPMTEEVMKAPVVQVAQKGSAEIAQLPVARQFVAANEEPAQNKKRVSEVSSDKVIGDIKSQDLFTVKPQKGSSEKLNLEFQTPEGEVLDLDGMDESLENIMEVVARKVSLDNRVEGFSKQAMVKTSVVASQVNIQMRQLIGQGGGQVNFRLDPPELGEVDVQLQISKGTVKGTIIVQSMEVAEQLARDLRLLQESLQEAGLNLSEEGLQFKLKDDQPDSERRQSEGGSKGDGDDDIESDSIAADSDAGRQKGWVKPDALVDVSV